MDDIVADGVVLAAINYIIVVCNIVEARVKRRITTFGVMPRGRVTVVNDAIMRGVVRGAQVDLANTT